MQQSYKTHVYLIKLIYNEIQQINIKFTLFYTE